MSNSWLEVLRQECQPPKSQRQVASQLVVSPAQISLVLRGAYEGDLKRIQTLVEGKYMHRVVDCPVLGEIPISKCLWHQEREFAATNPQRVMLYKACRSGCENSKLDIQVTKCRQSKLLAESSRSKEKVIYCKPVSEPVKGSSKPVQFNTEMYSARTEITRLRKIARGSEGKLIELLEEEITSLANKYNRLIQK